MTKISFLGSCREIGRSAILIESNSGIKCMLDYGIGFHNEDRLPYLTDLNNLKAIALTHSHIDHSGGLPFIYKNFKVPLFTNPVSLTITDILIRDMINISNYPYPFGYRELEKMKQNAYFLENGFRQRVSNNFFITFINAGHIPGSVSILIEVDNKKVLYSGDINTQNTNLMNAAKPSEIPEIDTLIIESTYALREHPSRTELEKDFIERINSITENGGRVLIPAFGVARSQETLLILDKYNYPGKIFMDGLARKVSRIFLEYPQSIKNPSRFKSALKKTQFILRRKGRHIAKKTNGVIISPSGMLKGGAVIHYIDSIINDPISGIFLVGYQVEGSPGRELLDNGFFQFKEKDRKGYTINDFKIKAKCDYDYFDFSSHADSIHLKNYIDKIRFHDESNQIYCIHGDSKSTTHLASELVRKGYNSVSPEIGEIYKI